MKVSSRELINRLQAANRIVPVGATFTHYNHGSYRVTDLVIDEKTESVMVVYVSTSGVLLKYVRPFEEWYQNVLKTIPADPWNGPGEMTFTVPRFKLYHKYEEVFSHSISSHD